jgi:hypothetical protein
LLKYNAIRLRPETFDSDATKLADALSNLSPLTGQTNANQGKTADLSQFYSRLSGMVSVDALAFKQTDSWVARIGKGGVWYLFWWILGPYFAIRRYGIRRIAPYVIVAIILIVIGVIADSSKP